VTGSGYRRIGSIGKAHGLRGEFTVRLESDLPRWVAECARLYVEEHGAMVARSVTAARFDHGKLVMGLEALPDRTAVEAARGTALYVPEDEARAAIADRSFYYNSDLIGMALVDADSGETYGTVRDVVEMPAQNLLEVEPAGGEGKTFLVPFTAAFVPAVDLEAKAIRVRLPEGLMDL